MSDHERVYSDEEFALILRKATEIASRADAAGDWSTGLTLTDMQSAAAQVGVDLALIARAARMLAVTPPESTLDRLIGGPIRHEVDAHFPVVIDESSAALLLSAVRIAASEAGSRDVGHSSALGMTWHDGGQTEALGISTQRVEDGTDVTVVFDRRGTLAVVGMTSGIVIFLSTMFAAFALYPDSAALGLAGFVAGVGGTLAAARSYWAASTRKARERIGDVLTTIGRTLAPPETSAASLSVAKDEAATAEGAPGDVVRRE